MIDQHVNHMTRLIDDLLDVSRISQGRLELRRERVMLDDLVEAAIGSIRHELEAHRHTLRVTLPEVPIAFRADRARLIQVLSNLLTNAVRYSPPGGEVVIAASITDFGQLRLSVQDRGAGIPSEKLEEIFHLFAQLDRSLEREGGGLGIGLTLSRQIVQLHGGTIEARSEGPGRGSEFIVKVPIHAPGPAVQAIAPPAAAVTLHRIVIADDNRDAADSLAMVLERRGHEVYRAYDGAAALELAIRQVPDVLLLDIGMPKLDGYEVARRIRALPWGKNVLLVALTGWGQEKAGQEAREAGFDAHVVKPATPAMLERLLAGEVPVTPPRRPARAPSPA
jgi:CheY-like chemotaxis protein